MTKHLLLAVLGITPVTIFAQTKLTVNGKVTNLPEKAVVYINDLNNPTDTVAKAVSSKGVFVLKGKLEEPKMLGLFMGSKKIDDVFFDNSTITIRGDYNNPKKIAITGSKSQTAFKELQTKFIPDFEKLNEVRQKMQMGDQSQATQDTAELVTARIEKNIDSYIRKYSSSPVSAFLLLVTAGMKEDPIGLEARAGILTKAAMANSYGTYLTQMIADSKVGAVGSIAMDFTQNDTLDQPVSLASFRGKYVLLDFWASWCGPCRRENPNVVSNFQRFKDKNFTVLGVSLDRQGQKAQWLQAIHADNLTWTHVSDLQFWSNSVAQLYKVQSIPQNYLIGPDGKIIAKNLRGEELESKLCELLGCN